ncbi:uncharacterized protein LOC101461444 isoform X2 [Ceratitis capitata]|uniref:uncharacterized protein LOC101461444 isoform X2 n=1 Tax=Ceratitis capitata TaxID=7213 RepID=UPI00032A3F6E|nr:uncharacterized protein LOC101461444 isoform X2 [Ceratitis capitata]
MVLRSGIIIPFQFRDSKKLLMIGVPEENRNLNIWDLRNVVRAAFGIYNFEFRNKKIGFNIPDELLLHYLAQRRDLTNFVIEVGQVYDPCKENFTSMGSCNTCHCPAAQKSSLELHDNVSTSIYNAAAGGRSNASGTSSQNSQNADELPVMKMRMQHANIPPSEISHMEIEPKIDYDGTINTTGANTDADESSPPPMSLHAKPGVYLDEEHHQHQQQQQQQQELHLERLQHEYALQQHQQQQHFEAMMQENTTGNSFRQRKERMSKKQKEIYVNFMEQNPVINEHRRGDPILDQYWGKLADILNSVPQGAVKHVAEWKQTFDNWRYRVFLYARYNSKITGADALNPKSFKPFTQTDKRAYHFWIRNPDTAPPDLEKMRNVFVNLEETQQE